MKLFTVYYSWQHQGEHNSACVDVVAANEDDARVAARETVPGDEIVIEEVEEI